MRRRAFLRTATLPLIVAPAVARAQSFPNRPLTIIVPFSAGGPLDTLCRILAEPMQASLGQSVVIEDVTGAGGAIGITRVARSTPDGYTLISGNQGSHITLGAMQQVSFDLERDFAPIVMFATTSQLVLVRKSLDVSNLREFLAWVKANPGKVTDGGGGYGTVAHTSLLFFQQLSGTNIHFVPYRGASAALQDLLAGQIDMMIDQPSNSLPHVQAGKVKALAVTAPTRLAAAPDIPTADEAGLPGFYTSIWQALWAPRGTPESVIETLNKAVRDALLDPKVKQRFVDLGQEIPPTEQQTARWLADFQKTEIDKWVPLVKAAKVNTD
ncbi:MAG: tripartite tricarboxylate transporter substrate binding protein BugD [Reyranella sp.]|nr:tripartite tricarboxylate transporter substrate binding protein BugD [Reyranella sp.]